MRKSNRTFLLIVLIPAFLEVFIFLIFPIFGTGAISFLNYNPLRSVNEFIGLDNYRRLLGDADAIIAFRNTIVFTVITVTLNIITALFLATMISQLKSNKSRSLFRMVVFMPCMAPMAASAVVWARSLYNPNSGLFNIILTKLGFAGLPWISDAKFLMGAIIFYTIWVDVGYNTILFTAGMDGIPQDLYHAAALDGAGRWKLFSKITFPLLGRTTAFIILMTLISHFQMFAQFNIMASNDGPQKSGLVLTGYIYKNAFVYKDMGYAAAISVAFFVLILCVSLVQQRLSKVDWEY